MGNSFRKVKTFRWGGGNISIIFLNIPEIRIILSMCETMWGKKSCMVCLCESGACVPKRRELNLSYYYCQEILFFYLNVKLSHVYVKTAVVFTVC